MKFDFGRLRQDDSDILRLIFKNEEINAEKRIIKISFRIILAFLCFIMFLLLFSDSSFRTGGLPSNMAGLLFFSLYTLIIYFFIRANKHSGIIKYLTIFTAVTAITIVIAGYSLTEGFVHTARTATLSAYFIPILISGLYQQPYVPLYAGSLVSLEYLILLFFAGREGYPVMVSSETFSHRIITLDVVSIHIASFMLVGILLHTITARQQILMRQLNDSITKLTRIKEDKKRSEQKAAFFEKYDKLTQLPNFIHFEERARGQLEKASSRKQIFALMCLGLDSFKNVNHLYGTEIGSQVLQDVGMRIDTSFRDDDFICRFMGDKFLILLSDLKSSYNIPEIIRKTQSLFESPYTIGDQMIKITASAGICTYPNDGESISELIKKSEAAMYKAKSDGKNRFNLYDSSMQDEMNQRIRIENELYNALSLREFRMVYQPKVDKAGKLKGVESLLRWDSAVLGPVRPDLFIPIAEDCGVIISLGYHIFEMVCRQAKIWSDKGYEPFRITINVSPRQFAQKDFSRQIKRIIGETDVSSRWIGIEITESGIMENETDCIEKLKDLKEMGITISIDDFGKGYSSMTRLGSYPLDTLKIDKSFIDGIPRQSSAGCIVRSIIDLAHNLNYSVIAEGVENSEQVDFLSVNGCNLFQGYYFHKPMEADDFEKTCLIPLFEYD